MQPVPTESAVPSSMASPEAVRELERFTLAMPQVEIQTQHLVHGGLYARTIFVPAGTLITGAQMNKDNICVMHGDMSVTTDEGTVRLTGFHVIPASAGFKRAGFAHADTYWTTLMPTQHTDLNDIEDEMTDESSMLQTRRDQIGFTTNPVLKGQ